MVNKEVHEGAGAEDTASKVNPLDAWRREISAMSSDSSSEGDKYAIKEKTPLNSPRGEVRYAVETEVVPKMFVDVGMETRGDDDVREDAECLREEEDERDGADIGKNKTVHHDNRDIDDGDEERYAGEETEIDREEDCDKATPSDDDDGDWSSVIDTHSSDSKSTANVEYMAFGKDAIVQIMPKTSKDPVTRFGHGNRSDSATHLKLRDTTTRESYYTDGDSQGIFSLDDFSSDDDIRFFASSQVSREAITPRSMICDLDFRREDFGIGVFVEGASMELTDRGDVMSVSTVANEAITPWSPKSILCGAAEAPEMDLELEERGDVMSVSTVGNEAPKMDLELVDRDSVMPESIVGNDAITPWSPKSILCGAAECTEMDLELEERGDVMSVSTVGNEAPEMDSELVDRGSVMPASTVANDAITPWSPKAILCGAADAPEVDLDLGDRGGVMPASTVENKTPEKDLELVDQGSVMPVSTVANDAITPWSPKAILACGAREAPDMETQVAASSSFQLDDELRNASESDIPFSVGTALQQDVASSHSEKPIQGMELGKREWTAATLEAIDREKAITPKTMVETIYEIASDLLLVTSPNKHPKKDTIESAYPFDEPENADEQKLVHGLKHVLSKRPLSPLSPRSPKSTTRKSNVKEAINDFCFFGENTKLERQEPTLLRETVVRGSKKVQESVATPQENCPRADDHPFDGEDSTASDMNRAMEANFKKNGDDRIDLVDISVVPVSQTISPRHVEATTEGGHIPVCGASQMEEIKEDVKDVGGDSSRFAPSHDGQQELPSTQDETKRTILKSKHRSYSANDLRDTEKAFNVCAHMSCWRESERSLLSHALDRASKQANKSVESLANEARAFDPSGETPIKPSTGDTGKQTIRFDDEVLHTVIEQSKVSKDLSCSEEMHGTNRKTSPALVPSTIPQATPETNIQDNITQEERRDEGIEAPITRALSKTEEREGGVVNLVTEDEQPVMTTADAVASDGEKINQSFATPIEPFTAKRAAFDCGLSALKELLCSTAIQDFNASQSDSIVSCEEPIQNALDRYIIANDTGDNKAADEEEVEGTLRPDDATMEVTETAAQAGSNNTPTQCVHDVETEYRVDEETSEAKLDHEMLPPTEVTETTKGAISSEVDVAALCKDSCSPSMEAPPNIDANDTISSTVTVQEFGTSWFHRLTSCMEVDDVDCRDFTCFGNTETKASDLESDAERPNQDLEKDNNPEAETNAKVIATFSNSTTPLERDNKKRQSLLYNMSSNSKACTSEDPAGSETRQDGQKIVYVTKEETRECSSGKSSKNSEGVNEPACALAHQEPSTSRSEIAANQEDSSPSPSSNNKVHANSNDIEVTTNALCSSNWSSCKDLVDADGAESVEVTITDDSKDLKASAWASISPATDDLSDNGILVINEKSNKEDGDAPRMNEDTDSKEQNAETSEAQNDSSPKNHPEIIPLFQEAMYSGESLVPCPSDEERGLGDTKERSMDPSAIVNRDEREPSRPPVDNNAPCTWIGWTTEMFIGICTLNTCTNQGKEGASDKDGSPGARSSFRIAVEDISADDIVAAFEKESKTSSSNATTGTVTESNCMQITLQMTVSSGSIEAIFDEEALPEDQCGGEEKERSMNARSGDDRKVITTLESGRTSSHGERHCTDSSCACLFP